MEPLLLDWTTAPRTLGVRLHYAARKRQKLKWAICALVLGGVLVKADITYAFDSLVEISASPPADEYVREHLRRLQLDPADARVRLSEDFLLLQAINARFCLGKRCATWFFSHTSGRLLTSAFLERAVVLSPRTPIFLPNTVTWMFGIEHRTYVVLGPEFGMVIPNLLNK